LDRRAFRLLFALVLVARIAISARPVATYDAFSYAIVAEAVSSGHVVYDATTRYNYSPLWSWVLAALWTLAGADLLRFVLLVGLLLNAADAVSAWLVLRIARDSLGRSPDEARRLALLFFSNPVSAMVTCQLRQFDGVSIALLLAAVLAAASTRRGRGWRASLALAVSMLVKHVTALQPVVFAVRRRRGERLSPALAALPYVVFALSFLPFVSSFRAIRDNVLLYGTGLSGSRGQRPGGLQLLLAIPDGGRAFFFALFVAAAALAIWFGRRLELPRASLLVFLAMLTTAPGFGGQYLVWPIALGSLYPSAAYALFSTLGAGFMASEARLVTGPIGVTAAGAWVGALVWGLHEARAARDAARYDDGVAEALQTSSTASG